ncbi:putative divalent cation/proton antiporter TMEM165 isoform X2 [Linepithema humile]|uniref:putative divalent cation/proton antiporter TMEM165 isoform X2 n=1 Tax=Linepithema humile TaxID=83485 RepID=UPI0006230622|nr:PREDICTED: transmembrane protein 165 isoform X2 [Linepithema humile]
MRVERLIYIFCLILIFHLSTVVCEIQPHYDEKFQTATSTKLPEFVSEKPQDRLGFLHAFIAALSVIVVSELGDKTFFIAAIMAMKHPRLTVFVGAISALALMTILSVVFGYAATIIPRAYTYYISTLLFALFGLKMLRDGYYMSPTEAQEELEEVQSDLRKRDDEYEKETASTLVQDAETGVIRKATKASALMLLSRILLQAFTLTFLAEWGDRSQLTTIILAAREDVYGVVLGGILGHSFCTGLAVLGGRIIAQRISVRTVTIIGGLVFLLFAVTALFVNPMEDV